MVQGDHFFIHSAQAMVLRDLAQDLHGVAAAGPRAAADMSGAEQGWASPPVAPELADGMVHVWAAPLDPPADTIRRSEALLAPDERARADRFRFERDRRRFTVARGVLRTLLGRYLGTDPRGVAFRYESHGKPVLGEPFAERGIRFNVSHSGEMALYAFARGRELGVDVEEVRRMDDGLDIAERFFSEAEVAAFRALPRRSGTTRSSTAGRARKRTSRRWARDSPFRCTSSTCRSPRASRRVCWPPATPAGGALVAPRAPRPGARLPRRHRGGGGGMGPGLLAVGRRRGRIATDGSRGVARGISVLRPQDPGNHRHQERRRMKTRRTLLVAALALGMGALPAWSGTAREGTARTRPAAAAEYEIDQSHSQVLFKVKHLGISTVTGRFRDFAGTITYDPQNPAAARARATIKTASIDTDNDRRDNHLRSADFFEAEKYRRSPSRRAACGRRVATASSWTGR
jgi:hypothetical protein